MDVIFFTVILSMIILTLLLLVDFLLVDKARMSNRFIGAVLSILFGLFVAFMIFILYYVVTGGQPDCQ